MVFVKIVIGILLLVILAAVGAYILLPKSTTPAPASQDISFPTQNPKDASELQAGGNSYMGPDGVFTILYPTDFRLDESDLQHPRIYKTGATQKGQTEIYDGAMVVFEVVNLNGKSLSEWVDDTIEAQTADGTLTITEPKKATTLNNFPGFSYKTRGLGEATYYVVQKDTASENAVVITTAVMDPENVGYAEEVRKILATLQVLK